MDKKQIKGRVRGGWWHLSIRDGAAIVVEAAGKASAFSSWLSDHKNWMDIHIQTGALNVTIWGWRNCVICTLLVADVHLQFRLRHPSPHPLSAKHSVWFSVNTIHVTFLLLLNAVCSLYPLSLTFYYTNCKFNACDNRVFIHPVNICGKTVKEIPAQQIHFVYYKKFTSTLYHINTGFSNSDWDRREGDSCCETLAKSESDEKRCVFFIWKHHFMRINIFISVTQLRITDCNEFQWQIEIGLHWRQSRILLFHYCEYDSSVCQMDWL